jgi:hypothetical protein
MPPDRARAAKARLGPAVKYRFLYKNTDDLYVQRYCAPHDNCLTIGFGLWKTLTLNPTELPRLQVHEAIIFEQAANGCDEKCVLGVPHKQRMARRLRPRPCAELS